MSAIVCESASDLAIGERAMRFYHREFGADADQPSEACTEVYEQDGKRYVRLGNVTGVLATYIVSPLRGGGVRLHPHVEFVMPEPRPLKSVRCPEIDRLTERATKYLDAAEPHIAKAVKLLKDAGVPDDVWESDSADEWSAVRVLQNAERAHMHVTDYFGS